MGRGRPRKPMQLALLDGSFSKNPQRYRDRLSAEIPTLRNPLGSPPEGLNQWELAAWHEITSYAPPGTFGESDRIAVELTARLMGRVRTGRAKASDIQTLRAMLSEFGLTPASRSKIKLTGEAPVPDLGKPAESPEILAIRAM